jgi:hypothetical protein
MNETSTPLTRLLDGIVGPDRPDDRVTTWLSLAVGAVAFTAFMGWGPIGQYLSGIGLSNRQPTITVTTDTDDGSHSPADADDPALVLGETIERAPQDDADGSVEPIEATEAGDISFIDPDESAVVDDAGTPELVTVVIPTAT